MKCDRFRTWLEDRDLYDVSEADKAHRHATECQYCNEMLRKDEILDRYIARALAAQQVPAGLSERIDLNLAGQTPERSRKGTFTMIAALCLLILATVFFHGGRQRFGTMEELATYALLDHQKHDYGEAIFERVVDAGNWLAINGWRAAAPPALILEGYTVKGAKICRLGHCQAVHLIYEKEGRLVSVFVLAEGEVGFDLAQERVFSLVIEGHGVRILRQQSMVYAVIS